jgi:hypothetical protein
VKISRSVFYHFRFVEAISVGFRKLGHWCVIVGAVAFVLGCGGGQKAAEIVPVKGVVKYQGKPVPKLSVGFVPENGTLAYGTTDDNGQFALTTNKPGDGATVGTYKVAIKYVPDEIPAMPGFPGSEKKVTSTIPEKYANAETSGLKRTVEKDGVENNFTFELSD